MNIEVKQRIYKIRSRDIPKGFRKSKIGVLPIDWNTAKLEKIGSFLKGKGVSKSEVIDEGIPCIRYGEIYTSHNDFIKEFKSFISKEVTQTSERIFRGDLLFAGSGETQEDIGKSVAYINDGEAYAGGDIVILRPNKIYDSKYLGYALNGEIFNVQRRKLGQGHSVVHIYAKDLKDIIIPIPEGTEQQKIANILSTWDKAIELKEKLIKQKKEQKSGLTNRLLTSKVRLSRFEEEWKEVRLGDYLVKHDEKSEFNNQYPVLTSSRRGIFLQKDYFDGNDVASKDNTGYNVVPKGYFTYRHMSDDLIFKFNINTIVEKGIVSTLYPVFTTREIDNYFLKALLNEGNEFKKFALGQKQGGSRTYMYFSNLQELSLTIPSREEQEKISNLLICAEREIDLLEQELQALKLQKKGLMQLLLTGIVRVIPDTSM